MENNENTLENTEIPSQTDSIQPSPSDNTVTETVEDTQTETETTEETIVEEETAGEELTEETTNETTVTEKETEVILESPASIDYTETLLAISEHTQLTSARVEYANCLLIVIILVIILNYAYKFFKMFF